MFKGVSSMKGFTLIEMLVVIVIIGILSSLILVNLSSARAKARDTKRVSDLAQIQLALEQYFDRCGQYPSKNGQAVIFTAVGAVLGNYSNGCPTGISLASFISKIPTPPTGGSVVVTHYDYETPSTYNDFVLHATFENYLDAMKDGLNGTPFAASAADSDTFNFATCSGGVLTAPFEYCVGTK